MANTKAKTQEFQSQIIDGINYVSTVYRGCKYMVYQCKTDGDWCVTSRRLALGRSNVGGCRYYNTLAEVSNDRKAFYDLNKLTAIMYRFDI